MKKAQLPRQVHHMAADEMNCMVTSFSIYNGFTTQLDTWAIRHALKASPITDAALHSYAAKCSISFSKQLGKCKTDDDHIALQTAYLARMEYSGRPEFLRTKAK